MITTTQEAADRLNEAIAPAIAKFRPPEDPEAAADPDRIRANEEGHQLQGSGADPEHDTTTTQKQEATQ